MSTLTLPLSFRRLPSPHPVSIEWLALAASLYFTLVGSRVAWQRMLDGRDMSDPATWRLVGGLFVAVAAFQFIVLAAVLTRRTARAVLSVLLVGTALASHFMQAYGVFLDAAMLRNVLHTDVREARELLSWPLAAHVAWQAGVPLLLLWRTPIAERSWPLAASRRGMAMAAAAAVCAMALLAQFQEASALVRNHREWRYLVAPSNYLYALGRVVAGDASASAHPLQPIGTDAVLGPTWPARTKPVLLVLVVGETARSANWGLNGYARQTTPELAQVPDLLNFPDVQACGTSTEVSLPCMFSPGGRHDYDEARIRGHESLLHVLAHAGFQVLWRDNQSGCKGVCAGLASEQLQTMDEALVDGLDARVAGAGANRVLVLHELGSHGPAYADRYPAAYARFEPACHSSELRQCSPQQIVNAYDNSLLYTDHVLARVIGFAQSMQPRYDTAVVYVSDHGESLGEYNLYLHGMPRAIAPREQTQVPMVMWLSAGLRHGLSLDSGCLRERAMRPASHDHLFHTMLGLADVTTSVYDARFDITAPCRIPPA